MCKWRVWILDMSERKGKKKKPTIFKFLLRDSVLLNVIPNHSTSPISLSRVTSEQPLSFWITNYCLLYFLLNWIKATHLGTYQKICYNCGAESQRSFSLNCQLQGSGLFSKGWKIYLGLCLKILSEEAVHLLFLWLWVPGSVFCFECISFKLASGH